MRDAGMARMRSGQGTFADSLRQSVSDGEFGDICDGQNTFLLGVCREDHELVNWDFRQPC